MARKLGQPLLPDLCRRFLYDQLYPDPELSAEDVTLDDCPILQGRISRFQSGQAIFFAPTEDSGSSGMHRETIRSHPRWRRGHPRHDTVLIQNGDDAERMRGMIVGRVLSFLRFTHDDVRYDAALVQWFLPVGDQPDTVTGMWMVKPEIQHGRRSVGLVHVDSIVRGCHLIGVYGRARLPKTFHFSSTHDAFDLFYVNHFIDYHAHECIP